MLNVCEACGAYRADKVVEGGHAICPECGHRHPFLRLPLLLVTGASGSGKTSVCRRMPGLTREVIVLDCDILWGPHFEHDARGFFETWLRVCKNVAQAGRPVALFGAGTGVPDNLEACVERRYFSTLHYLALTCDDAVLADRLRRRPAWRNSGSDAYIAEHAAFNRWFKERGPTASPVIDILDTTRETIDETAIRVRDWLHARLAGA